MQELRNPFHRIERTTIAKRLFAMIIGLSAITVVSLLTLANEDASDARSDNASPDSVIDSSKTVSVEEGQTKDAKQRERESSSRNGSEGRVHVQVSLESRDDVDRLLREFPDLSHAATFTLEYHNNASIPDVLLERIAEKGKGLRELAIGRWTTPNGRLAEISDAGMGSISGMSNLDTLILACRFSAKSYARLARLKRLETLSFHKPAFGARKCFEVASRLPNIRVLGIHYADLSQPIDAETFRAIASLNGRLEDLNFGEWQETTIHASMIPAIAEVKSLTHLYLGEIKGTLPHPLAHYLRTLPYLERLEPYGTKETAGATAFEGLRMRDKCPVQFRKVKSPAEMVVLLRFILSNAEADKVRREVVHRRAGLSPHPPEDYPQSKYPLLATIFVKSFGVELPRGASRVLGYISGQYPELDLQIRRYLAGEDFLEKEEEKGEPVEREE